jgi:hypothetical protein
MIGNKTLDSALMHSEAIEHAPILMMTNDGPAPAPWVGEIERWRSNEILLGTHGLPHWKICATLFPSLPHGTMTMHHNDWKSGLTMVAL